MEKSQKAGFFAPDNYGQTSHSAPFNTYPDIFESTTFLIRIKKNSTSTGTRIQTDSLDSSGNIGSRASDAKRAKFESFSAFHGKELGSIFLRHRIKNSGSSVHIFPDSERIQKFPLWRVADSYVGRIHRIRVDGNRIRKKKKKKKGAD